MGFDFNLSEENVMLVDALGEAMLNTAPVSKEMMLNFIAEWELGLPKSY